MIRSGCASSTAGSINYTSGTVEQCKAQHCFVGFYVGPSPGGGRVDFKQNHLTQNFEASLQACGTPNFWSAPAQPASLALNVSSNRFENGGHIGEVELYIRDYTPSAMGSSSPTGLLFVNVLAVRSASRWPV